MTLLDLCTTSSSSEIAFLVKGNLALSDFYEAFIKRVHVGWKYLRFSENLWKYLKISESKLSSLCSQKLQNETVLNEFSNTVLEFQRSNLSLGVSTPKNLSCLVIYESLSHCSLLAKSVIQKALKNSRFV